MDSSLTIKRHLVYGLFYFACGEVERRLCKVNLKYGRECGGIKLQERTWLSPLYYRCSVCLNI